MGWLDNLKKGMKKTAAVFKLTKVDFESLEELEESLLRADVGYTVTDEIIKALQKKRPQNMEQLRGYVREELINRLTDIAKPLQIDKTKKPYVVLMTGVNGAGKTTTIGKLANIFVKQGKSVVIAAADTFRAAAGEQLEVWAKRAGVRIIKHEEGSDPAAVVFDAVSSAKSKGTDIVLVDTAGRLHNKKNLMEELKKIDRVIEREHPTATRKNLIVLDATTGQNAIAQVEVFDEAIDIDGIVLTKLDGTAKGGVVLAIKHDMDIPVYFVGVGEGIDDLLYFDPQSYVEGII